jgi:hypothetical protein
MGKPYALAGMTTLLDPVHVDPARHG